MSDPFGSTVLYSLTSLACTSPVSVVMLIGGVASLRRLFTKPREGWLVGTAIGLNVFAFFGVSNVVELAIRFVPSLLACLEPTVSQMWMFFYLHAIPASLAQAAAWGLILYAAFGEGSGPRSKYLVEDEQSEQKSA